MENTTDNEKQKEIRQCILSFFSAFDAETLPPPSTDPYVMWNIEDPRYQKDISPSFLQQVEIFNYCAPKKGFTGGNINGFRIFNNVAVSSPNKCTHALV